MRAQSIHELVFVFPGALGDFLLALPTLRLLRARHAATTVTAVVPEQLRSLVAMTGVAGTIASLDGADTAWLFGGSRLPAWLAGRPVVYSWLGTRDPGLRARLDAVAVATRYLGIERGEGRVHAARAYARAAGVADDDRTLVAAAGVVAPMSARADALLAACDRPVLAIHPGAGAHAKRWAAAGFVGVARWWRRRGGSVMTVGGPAEPDLRGIADGAVARGWGIPDLAALLARATLFVGNDSGVSHLAAAVGTPGVAVFGPTDSRRWRPLGGRVVPVRGAAVGPAGMSLDTVPIARVVAACRRQLTLTRADPETSVRVALGRERGCKYVDEPPVTERGTPVPAEANASDRGYGVDSDDGASAGSRPARTVVPAPEERHGRAQRRAAWVPGHGSTALHRRG